MCPLISFIIILRVILDIGNVLILEESTRFINLFIKQYKHLLEYRRKFCYFGIS